MPKAAIFDIDGTLVDSVPFHAEAWVIAFAKFGYSVTFEQMQKQIGKGGEFLMETVLTKAEMEQVGKEIHGYRKEYFQSNFLPKVQPFPQVKALFEQLHTDGLAIVLASSAQPESAQHYIDLLGVADLIQGCTTTGDVEKAKPYPDVFEAALEKLPGISAQDAIVIGDSPYDAEAAGKISLITIGLLSGGFSETELRAAGCIAIYQDPADLLTHYSDSPLSASSLNSAQTPL